MSVLVSRSALILGIAAATCAAFLTVGILSYKRGAMCGCFGRFGNRATARGDVMRSALLLGAAVLAFIAAVRSGSPEVTVASVVPALLFMGLWLGAPSLIARTESQPGIRQTNPSIGRRDLLLRGGLVSAAIVGAKWLTPVGVSAETLSARSVKGGAVTTFRRIPFSEGGAHELVPFGTSEAAIASLASIRSQLPAPLPGEARVFFFEEPGDRVAVIRHWVEGDQAVNEVFGLSVSGAQVGVVLVRSTAVVTDSGVVRYQVTSSSGDIVDSGTYGVPILAGNCDASCSGGNAAAAASSGAFCSGVVLGGCSPHPAAWFTCPAAFVTCATFSGGAAAAATVNCDNCEEAEEKVEEEQDDCGCVACWDWNGAIICEPHPCDHTHSSGGPHLHCDCGRC